MLILILKSEYFIKMYTALSELKKLSELQWNFKYNIYKYFSTFDDAK